MLLEAVTLARDVGRDFDAVRQAHAGDLAKRRVRLLRRLTVRTCVHTPRFCGEPFGDWVVRLFSALKRKRSAGALVFFTTGVRPGGPAD